MTDPVRIGAVIPRATYRLQLHKGFDFAAATAVLPYLQRLGISHVYCSPIGCARPGSLHGYDVIDHAHINPELGGEAGFEIFAAAAKALGMGLLLDQVPNHMGVFGADNAWWVDVLKNGQASEFAGYFDIAWQSPNRALHGRVLVPVLGGHYGDVLDGGELQLHFEPQSGVGSQALFSLRYHEHTFPIDPRSIGALLRRAAAHVREGQDVEARNALQRFAADFAELPAHDVDDETLRVQRRASSALLQQRFTEAVAADAGVRAAIDAAVQALNAEPGRDALDALHEAQAYRLAYWRIASDEINYRRFFDVNELAATRVEDERVFEATQGLALGLAARGLVDGLRIDHPDGLLDPATFFRRLQAGYAQRRGLPAQGGDAAAPLPLYVVAEKISAAHESLPADWALHGTTGYNFAALVNGLFVERLNAARMERVWRAFTGTGTGAEADFATIVHQCKRDVAHQAFASQLTLLAQALQSIALADRRTRDHGFNTLRDALAEVAAAMPVYRTYVIETASAQDRRFIDWAIGQARRRSALADPALFDFLRRCLLVEPGPQAPAGVHDAMRAFAMRFQQFCAPVAAKGVEDTAFYRYHRLASLNEVGGDPAMFGVSAAAFHSANADTAAHWPHTMLASSTHDNKRAEDVRHRIDVLSEQPGAWRLALRRWKLATRGWRGEVDGAQAPAPADEYLLYQTLIGSLPPEGLTPAELPAYRERIEAYALKAAREAKLQTSWARPNAAYEAALQGFVRGLLGRIEGNPVLADLQTRATEIAWFGALNGLAATLLRFTAPGVPDVYQGTELVDLSLVDPDNRRPVDYALRDRMLADAEHLLRTEAGSPALIAALASRASTPADGRLKQWIIWRLLSLRREMPALFESGSYAAVRVAGSRRRHVVAFVRQHGKRTLLVIAARKFFSLLPQAGQAPIGAAVWGDTRVQLPTLLPRRAAGSDVLTGGKVTWADGAIDISSAFHTLPFAAILLDA